jgi:hypothetical protein
MKTRPEGFLSQRCIDHDSEQFDYISELHAYLWRFVRTQNPQACGNIDDHIDAAIHEAETKARGPLKPLSEPP